MELEALGMSQDFTCAYMADPWANRARDEDAQEFAATRREQSHKTITSCTAVEGVFF